MVKLFLSPFKNMQYLHQRYGEIAGLAHGDPSSVIVFGPALNFRLLSNPELFINSAGPMINTSSDTGRLMRNNLTVMNGEKHRKHRRLMQPAFHKQQIVNYANDMTALTQGKLEGWRDRNEIELYREMQQLTQRIAVKTLFGTYDETELNRISVILGKMLGRLQFALFFPVDVPGTPYHKVQGLSRELASYIRSLVEQKRQQQDQNDVLAMLVHTHDEDGTVLSDDELIGHAFSLFVAGHETTSNALTWTLFLLNQHPQIAADLLDELEGTLHGNSPTLEQINKLPLLEWVIKESLRLLPPGIMGLRVTSEACELGGYELPKGASVFYSELITQRLPELYEDPNRFKPERWATLDRSPYEYLPFSAGRHMCIGWNFAMQELKLVLATIHQRYRIAPVPNIKVGSNVTMRPLPGLPVHIHPQDRQFTRVPVRGEINQLFQM
jgi:cytochrome P450